MKSCLKGWNDGIGKEALKAQSAEINMLATLLAIWAVPAKESTTTRSFHSHALFIIRKAILEWGESALLTLKDLITNINGKIFKDPIHEGWRASHSFMHYSCAQGFFSFLCPCSFTHSVGLDVDSHCQMVSSSLARMGSLCQGHHGLPCPTSTGILGRAGGTYIIKATLSAQEAPDFSLKSPGRHVLDKSRCLIKWV